MLELINQQVEELYELDSLSKKDLHKGEQLAIEEKCTLLTQSPFAFVHLVEGDKKEVRVTLCLEDGVLRPRIDKKPKDWDVHSVAALLDLQAYLKVQPQGDWSGRKYTLEGMKRRVLDERRKKAENTDYLIEWADNIYGEHVLYNERGVKYQLTLRDFEAETGYIDSPDLRTNKLGTTKHLMFAFKKLKENKKLLRKLKKQYPFVEIYLDPLNDYRISWFYPHKLPKSVAALLDKFFKGKAYIAENEVKGFLKFLQVAEYLDDIKIRAEVYEKVERLYAQELMDRLATEYTPDFSCVNVELFPYQKKGVEFVLFREGAIIADDMGLGKTLQAIAAAILKREIFGFKRTLVVCPASLKSQWKSEIEKFTKEKALVVGGKPEERKKIYADDSAYFYIVNYETVLRDAAIINEVEMDFVILDEAQRIKNYQTKTAHAIKQLKRKHALVITGTPIENRLVDLYSIVQFVDPYFLTPLWEFSCQHCYFDESSDNRIIGYYNLLDLKNRMQSLLIRREKRNVFKELPAVTQLNVPVQLHPNQADLHASYAKGIARILQKKFKTPFDMQRLMLLLTSMRMVCDSTFLIDKKTNHSSKLVELRRILTEKLDLQNNSNKIIIFSEWVRMNELIGDVLKDLGLSFVMLNGKVPVAKRKYLIKEFEDNDDCQVFLSTEAGGSGLNLQVADTVINFELPWNPAKKNQRIGRIDRLGQTSKKLLVINLLSRGSIEEKIASGLLLKQNLFDGVLDEESPTDEVDFSAKGRSQFLQQLEEVIDDLAWPTDDEVGEAEVESEIQPGPAATNIDTVAEETEEAEETLDAEKEAIPQPAVAAKSATNGQAIPQDRLEKIAQMETVMNQGLGFLAGLYKMSTGQELDAKDNKIEIDKETGEVVMRFKMVF